MPLVGTRPAGANAATARLTSLDTDHWQLRDAQIVQLLYEIDDADMLSLLPQALHPTIPPVVYINGMHVPDSSVGPFTLAEVRIGCRSGARPRAASYKAYVDSEAAARELSSRWGYPVAVAEVSLKKRYDLASLVVNDGGRTVLDVALINPEPISGSDIQYIAGLNLAYVPRDEGEALRFIQVDPDYVFQKADRGKPQLNAFEADAWEVPGARPVWPVSASYAQCDVMMPEIRYMVDPEKAPLAAVERR